MKYTVQLPHTCRASLAEVSTSFADISALILDALYGFVEV